MEIAASGSTVSSLTTTIFLIRALYGIDTLSTGFLAHGATPLSTEQIRVAFSWSIVGIEYLVVFMNLLNAHEAATSVFSRRQNGGKKHRTSLSRLSSISRTLSLFRNAATALDSTSEAPWRGTSWLPPASACSSEKGALATCCAKGVLLAWLTPNPLPRSPPSAAPAAPCCRMISALLNLTIPSLITSAFQRKEGKEGWDQQREVNNGKLQLDTESTKLSSRRVKVCALSWPRRPTLTQM